MSQVVHVGTLLGAALMLGASIWPGVLDQALLLAMLFAVVWVPLVLTGVVVSAVILYRRHRRGVLGAMPIREVVVMLCILMLTLLLLYFNVPRRAAFLAHRSSFGELARSAQSSGNDEPPVRLQVGLYRVDRYAVDPRGGIFFSVYSGSDGLGPDEMSYGFAYRPNGEGTPFGNARYAEARMAGNWYSFRASNDY